jgi:hypothetical protein
MMRASIAMATTRFSAERMVREYFEVLYRPERAGSAPASGASADGVRLTEGGGDGSSSGTRTGGEGRVGVLRTGRSGSA